VAEVAAVLAADGLPKFGEITSLKYHGVVPLFLHFFLVCEEV
jgi:hypothetical protein